MCAPCNAVPRFGLDPFGWLDAAERIAGDRQVDLLFPTQEQVTVLSALEPRLTPRTIVPPFAALMHVQDKISAFRALSEIGAPQPETIVVASADYLSRVKNLPAFVKRPVSTASSGVRRVKTSGELADAARAFGLGAGELIVQKQADGPLAMVQAVTQRGRLVAHHACLRLREGVGGGAALKESVALPEIPALLARLVAALDWHGGLSMDVIVGHDGPKIIDVNPPSLNRQMRSPRASILSEPCSTSPATGLRPSSRWDGSACARIRRSSLFSARRNKGEKGARCCAKRWTRSFHAAPTPGRPRN